MKTATGITIAHKKDGTLYYRASMTIKNKHISLGSYSEESVAKKAYQEACEIFYDKKYEIHDYTDSFSLNFEKFVILLNYRNSGIYFKTPIYLQTRYFFYYLSPTKHLIFDREDLFFYANHKIQVRGGYYFVSDYGSQYSILSRYGIKNYSQPGTDYIFVNQDSCDFRYENIMVINEYMGVSQTIRQNQTLYKCTIHVNGNLIVGYYNDKISAAIAYNKAVDVLHTRGITKNYIKNFITTYTSKQYQQAYDNIKISSKINRYPSI